MSIPYPSANTVVLPEIGMYVDWRRTNGDNKGMNNNDSDDAGRTMMIMSGDNGWIDVYKGCGRQKQRERDRER